jgi:hypothetical protein
MDRRSECFILRLVVASGFANSYQAEPDLRQFSLPIDRDKSSLRGPVESCVDGAGVKMRDQEIRTALDQHWAASDTNGFETEHGIYQETRCWDTHSQASESAVDATSRSRSLISRAKSALLSGESSAAVIFVSPNTS